MGPTIRKPCFGLPDPTPSGFRPMETEKTRDGRLVSHKWPNHFLHKKMTPGLIRRAEWESGSRNRSSGGLHFRPWCMAETFRRHFSTSKPSRSGSRTSGIRIRSKSHARPKFDLELNTEFQGTPEELQELQEYLRMLEGQPLAISVPLTSRGRL